MKITQKELVTFAESITTALEEIASKIGAVEDIISGDKEVDDVEDETEVEIDENDVDTDDVEDETEEEVADEDDEVVEDEEDETPAENFSERATKLKNFLNM